MTDRGWSEDKAAALESWQWPEERKMAACHLVVDNSASPEALAETARLLLSALKNHQSDMEKKFKEFWRSLAARGPLPPLSQAAGGEKRLPPDCPLDTFCV